MRIKLRDVSQRHKLINIYREIIREALCRTVIILSLTLDLTDGECPDAWVTFNRSCYLFSHETKTFTDAENYCLQHSGHLVHVETQAENEFLQNFCKELQNHNYWLGLTDTIIEGLWKWKENDETAVFTDFYPGEPGTGHAENCAIMYYPYGFAWVDYDCNGKCMPICEKKFPSSNGIIS